ncbi:putative bifunctional diguanylate cyclase/phosphodiesterase [Nocardioides mesophilus]|uniref:EAL domain-containing protein n=1 Tax=Nocardioides mesophilus TaxID=433659 RepID=A0A7G9R8S6_9ACTN|nr:GGDEF domain-containing phosphodiesterase [Nocardioides mesophilus]QNN52001.1 EAL domain-containing protein [Nocardioides mesophilus]
MFVVAPLVAGHRCWTAHRRRGQTHTGWAWLAVGCLVWAGGSMAFAAYDLGVGSAPPLPSPADLGYIGYALPVIIGASRFPVAQSVVWSHWRLTWDGGVIACSLLLASTVWVLEPLVEASSLNAATAVAMAYPLADVAVAAAVLTRLMVVPRTQWRVWGPLGAGWLVLTLTDSIYVTRTFHHQFAPGGLVDLGWLLSFALVAVAAASPPVECEVAGPVAVADPPSVLQQLLPYASLALAVSAVVAKPALTHGPLLWLVVPLAIAATGRQCIVVADHTASARHLSEAVARRTAELGHREQWWREVVHNLTDVVVVIDTRGAIEYRSPSAESTLGSWPSGVTTAEALAAHVHPEDLGPVMGVVEPVVLGRRRTGFVECRVELSDGSWGWFEVTVVGQLAERALKGTVLTLHDVSEQRRLTDRLTHEASHDALTGLPNRTLLMRRLAEVLAEGQRRRSALLLIDLDDFKVINDRHGHASGDLVLEVIARRLRRAVRADETVARLGGDEFALLMRGDRAQVQDRARRLIERIGKPVQAGGRTFLVRASIGAVFAGESDETPHSLLSHADIALYEAKARDKGGMVLIDGDERAMAAQQVHLREQIAQPDLEQFTVVYQPIVDLADLRVRGVECLLRWNQPDIGAVPPDQFIPMAEAGGSIQVLGWHVLREACAQLARWKQERPDHRIAVGINVSSRQLDEPGFAAAVLRLIAQHDLDPELVVVELTEQSLALDFETAVAVVKDLRAGGVSVAVDDYGTGYSSLRYLHRFDADVVKIDRSFISHLVDSPHTQKIVRSVMHMADSLDLQSIAEGIETCDQLALVRDLGCALGQGYLFSRPVAAEEILPLIGPDGVLVTAPALS